MQAKKKSYRTKQNRTELLLDDGQSIVHLNSNSRNSYCKPEG